VFWNRNANTLKVNNFSKDISVVFQRTCTKVPKKYIKRSA